MRRFSQVSGFVVCLLAPLAAAAGEAPSGPIEVEWQGKWYPAEVMKQDGAKTCIHYKGFAASWDECVVAGRIRSAAGAAAASPSAAQPAAAEQPKLAATGPLPPGRHRCPLDLPQKVYGEAINAQVSLAKDEVWTPENVYLVFGRFYLKGHSLTIQAGTTVCLDYESTPPKNGEPAFGNVYLDEGSTLKILGTPDKHVIFTQKNGFDQYYGGIEFTGGYNPACTVQNLDMYNAGASGGGWAIDSKSQHAPAIDLQNVHFYSMQRKGVNVRQEEGLTRGTRLFFHSYGSENLKDSYFLGYHLMVINSFGAKTLFGDMIHLDPGLPQDALHVSLHEPLWYKDVLFHKLPIPWQLIGDIKVAGNVGGEAALWTADPGCVFQMPNGSTPKIGDSQNSQGNVWLVGTADQPIVFTSYNRGTAASAPPAPGDWHTLLFVPGGFDVRKSKIDHAVFEYGGSNGPNTIYSCRDKTSSTFGELSFTTPLMGGHFAGIPITNTVFRKSAGNGIRGYCNVGPSNCLKTDYTKPELGNKFEDFSDPDKPGQLPFGCAP